MFKFNLCPHWSDNFVEQNVAELYLRLTLDRGFWRCLVANTYPFLCSVELGERYILRHFSHPQTA